MEIDALNQLIHIYGRDFIDPRGIQTLDSTIHKVTDTYRLSLSIDSAATHRSVAQGYIHLLESCIKPEYGLNIAKIYELLISSLEKAICSGDDKVAQFGAAHCFYFIVRAAFEKQYTELLKYLYSQYMVLFRENYIENDDYINCVSYLIQNCGIKQAAPYVGGLIIRCIRVLNSPDIHNLKAKEAACYLLFLLARMLHVVGDVIFEPFGYEVLNLLDPLRLHKNNSLRREAIKAYDEWKSLEHVSRSQSVDKGEFDFADLE